MAPRVAPDGRSPREEGVDGHRGSLEDGVADMGRDRHMKIPNKKLQDYVTHTIVKKKSPSACVLPTLLHTMLVVKSFLTNIVDI